MNAKPQLNTLAPSMKEAERMLDMLDAGGGQFTFQTFDDCKPPRSNTAHIYNGSLEQHFNALHRHNQNGCGVFVTVNQTDLSGRKAENIRRVRGLWVDFDTADHERLDRLISMDGIPPNLIVESSAGKHHAYWIIEEGGEIPLNQFTELQKRLIHLFAGDGADKAIHDLPRVMRLAGFYHRKGEPFMARVVHSDAWCDADELIRWVQSLPMPEVAKPKAQAEKPQAKQTQQAQQTHSTLDFKQAKLLARGRWPEIFNQLGYTLSTTAPHEHVACPMCGGSDRFRFDNENNDGSFICSQGTGEPIAGDGFALLEHGGKSAAEALGAVTHALYEMGLVSKFDNKDAAHQWGGLLPLVQANTSTATTYPIHAVPTLARGAIQAIAEHVQAPIAMTAQCVIGAMSHIAQAHVNAPDPYKEQGEPCGLFLLTEGQSGSRKTTSRNLADRAIIKHEKKQYEQYRSDLEQWKCLLAGCDKKDKSVFLAETPPPHDPITRYSDITLESLAGLYVDGAIKNASISSDEAAQFFGGHTMKSDTRNQALGGYTKLFDDGSVERTRSKSNLNGSGRAYDVRLTFNLQGQHEVLADALKDPVLRGQGFLPRFILTIPENLAGTRLQDESHKTNDANRDHRLIAYWDRCEYLLDECPLPLAADQATSDRRVISIDKEAESLELEFYNEIEQLQHKGQRYEYLQAFASRASQLARRLATVFAYFEGLTVIDRKTLSGACDVIRHSLGEWSRYADIEAVKESDAEKLIKWIAKKCAEQKTDRINYTNVQTSCPRPMQKDGKLLEIIIQQLEDSNYLKVELLNKKRLVVLNPLLLGKATK